MDSSTDHIRKKLLEIRLKLLDLSKRNRLLNFRHNKGAVKIIDELPKQVFDYLVKSGKPMMFLPLEPPENTHDDSSGDDEDRRESMQFEMGELVNINISDELPGPNVGVTEVPKKHRDNKLQTKLFAETLEARLRRMASKARTVIEETGKNQLYIALGFLKWKERNDTSKEFEAPLITIPVLLKRQEGLDPKTRCYQYTIQYTGEDLIPNLSLREKLKKDFDLILPDFEDERVSKEEEDDANDLDPEAYFEAVREMVCKMEGWEVRRKIVLGFFSFSKLMMYLDLDSKKWPGSSLENNPHILRLFGEESSTLSSTDPNEKDHESESFPLIVDADSSQTEAILHAMNGRSMIIQGPPGTGKSQTITNLIACFLNDGKSVLFLAEKMAALSVVHRNLERAGLADFCLELHSHKANKRDILDSLQKRSLLKTRDISFNHESQLKGLREYLGKYLLAITRPIGPKGESVYDVLGKSENLRLKLTDPLGLTVQNAVYVDEIEMQGVLSLLEALSRQYREIGDPRKNVWYGFEPESLVLGDEKRVEEYLNSAHAALARIIEKFEAFYTVFQIEQNPRECTVTNLKAIIEFATSAPTSLKCDLAASVFQTEKRELLDKVRAFQQSVHDYQEITLNAKTVFSDPSSISTDDADSFSGQLDRLLEWGMTIIDQSLGGDLSRTCDRILSLLQEYGSHIKNELTDAFADLRTLRDLDRVEATYRLLKSKPEEFDRIDKSQLFSLQIIPFATELLEEAERLLCERDGLSSIFAINDVCEIGEISVLRKVFRQSQGRLLRSFRKEYRKAKNVLCSFGKAESIVNNHALSDLLERLECFMRDERNFTEHAMYRTIFGDMFRGLDSDWDKLRSVLAWTADFLGVVGSPDEALSLVESCSGKPKSSEFNEELIKIVASIRTTIALYVAELVDMGTSDSLEEILFRGLSTVRKQLEEQRDICSAISKSNIMHTLPVKSDIRAIKTGVNAIIESNRIRAGLDTDQEVMSLLGSHFKGANTDIDSLMETVNWAFYIRTLLLPEELVAKLTEQNLSIGINEITKAADGLSQNLGLLDSSVKKLSQFGELDINTFFGQTPESLRMYDIEQKLTLALAEIVRLPKWADYRRFVRRAVVAGLEEIVEAIESGILPAEEACDAYCHAVYDSIARKQIRESTELATFTRADYEARREKFAALDKQIQTLYRKKIAHRTCQRPVPGGQKGARVKEWTEMCLLEKEFSKTRRHVPIRQLMNRARNAISALKPVYMMSPMSVAQFLEPGKHHFDVIIMDEASQIQPHDALGAIARASQMIVVGDSKQLPPTTFFQAEMDNPDDEQGEESIFDETDANFSILDMCDAVNIPSTRLQWHYRSEHESLIAFSNSMWYDNELVIFPSPVIDTAKLGIVFHHVDGATYASGKNEIEADLVAQHIIAHAKRFPELSLGVGTFNLRQRDVIEDRLDRLAREDPITELALEEFRKNHKDLEPLFIKNLENLQGDERDVIFISCTFGPDRDTGQVFQRFGPINGPNGSRRLNVLFTRAKKRMEVFSSMRHDDIIIGPGLEGRIALKKFLKYAESGDLPDYGETTDRGPDSDFEIAVAKAINNIGFRTKLQVGVSGYFIDIGVYHPSRPGEFILGVECDGAMYHSSKSARDRDRLREEVLIHRGWNIHRIWSVDWFKCRPDEIVRLKKRLEQLVESDRHTVVQVDEPLPSYQIGRDLKARKLSDEALCARVTLFCVENINRSFEAQKKDGFLQEEVLSPLVEKRIINMDEFREHVPVFVRANMNNDDVQYIHDIFEIIKQAS